MAKKSVPPLDNIVYYPVNTRVLWNGEPGFVHSLDIKPFDEYEIGYNITLDSQTRKNEPQIDNASYHELVFENTKEKSTDGKYVPPLKKLE